MMAAPHCLVIGYGNTLRRDDGVGVEVAQTIAALDLPGVQVITRQQLVPELAEPISKADAVIFVDADVAATHPELRPLEAASEGQTFAHAANPRSLLALSKEVFGGTPNAWSLAVPVEDLSFGFGLSPRSEKGLRAAVKRIQRLAAGLQKLHSE
jgi:hydrogenase maturation protease